MWNRSHYAPHNVSIPLGQSLLSVQLQQWFCPPGNSSQCLKIFWWSQPEWGGITNIKWIEARGVTKHSNKTLDNPLQQIIFQPKICIIFLKSKLGQIVPLIKLLHSLPLELESKPNSWPWSSRPSVIRPLPTSLTSFLFNFPLNH